VQKTSKKTNIKNLLEELVGMDTEDVFREIVGSENVKINESMKNHTSFKVGGDASVLVTPSSEEQIKNIVIFFKYYYTRIQALNVPKN
jgi:hypothetical protein